MQILAKAEFLNPGGSVKDRVALHIIQDAFAQGRLQEGGLITEGTAGSTGLHTTSALPPLPSLHGQTPFMLSIEAALNTLSWSANGSGRLLTFCIQYEP